MERYVGYLFGGGIAAVAGLWLLWLFAVGSVPWLAGATLLVTGLAGLGVGLAKPVDWSAL